MAPAKVKQDEDQVQPVLLRDLALVYGRPGQWLWLLVECHVLVSPPPPAALQVPQVIFAAVVALAAAAKLPGAPAPTPVPIIHQAQVNPELGTHNFEFESGNGIVIQESGSEGTLGGANRIGQFRKCERQTKKRAAVNSDH
ncbi:putative Cuticle protein AMP4-like 5 [Homarus americanus]|uniref:Putative Cuticle protein AMP4-like 5 n=1 Tax=Homarus americanus TaxID=6706 RepID=A0A8J5NA93_HOMAM|nr:putative Cuticle protein AMP4-like 5 [Homarus americanus]